MPTGYTDPLLKGEITTFPEFATLCTRAFGATIHMRDENMDTPYTPREYNTRYKESIAKAKKDLKDLAKKTDRELVGERRKELKDNIEYYQKELKRVLANRRKLTAMRKQVETWVPPTDEHVNFKEYMLQQIDSTITYDGNPKYYRDTIKRDETALGNLVANDIREFYKETYKRDVTYYTKERKEDVIRVDESNQWMTQFFNSIK